MTKFIKKDILNDLEPNKIEILRNNKILELLLDKLNKSAKKLEYICDFFVGGSFAKGTYLKNDFDIDIFCRFDLNYKDLKLSSYLENILLDTKLDFKKLKGSRNYFKILFGLDKKIIQFEIVPIRKIKTIQDCKNSTDFSPMHIDFIKKKIKKDKNLINEIRLAKMFFKAKKLYGAESYIGGFSGHSIEILILYYKSLENLLKKAKDWKINEIIDIENFYKKENILDEIGKEKISPLIIIDPILKERNASRALSKQKFFEFILISTLFSEFKLEDFHIEKENFKLFKINSVEFAKRINLNLILYSLDLEIKEESKDIVGSKLLKAFYNLKKFFLNYDFIIFKYNYFFDFEKRIYCFAFFFEKKTLSNLKIISGPKVLMNDAVLNFLKQKNEFFIENERVCIYKNRKIKSLKDICFLKLDDFKKFSRKNLDFIKEIKIIFK